MDRRIGILLLAGSAIWAEKAGSDVPTLDTPPDELMQFDFMLGARDCVGDWHLPDGTEKTFRASWHGSRILSGHMLIEEYVAWDTDGVIFVHGANTRAYSTIDGRWATHWQSVIDGASFELGQPTFDEPSGGNRVVTFINGDGDDLQRAVYIAHSDGRLSWRGDSTNDAGQNWDMAVMTIECGPPER